jgi:peptidyl-prolyl cis-trans isomerase D
MLVWVRKLLENWIARGFFGLLVVIFVFWGISNVLTLFGSDTAVAHVGGQAVDVGLVQAQFQEAVNQATQQGKPVDGPARQQLADQAMAAVLRQRLLAGEEARLQVSAPDSAVRDAIAAIPAFQTGGVFDQAKFNQVLQQNGISADRFVQEEKDDIADRQVVVAAIAGAGAPAGLDSQLYNFVAQQRFAQTIQVTVAGQPAPGAPGDAVLQRYWRNHPDEFTAPEYRTIKLVVLAPSLLAGKETVSQSDIDAAYARVSAAQPRVALRSVQVVAAPDLAASSRLQAAWKSGADWDAVQKMAKSFGAAAVELDDTPKSGIPTAALQDAAFAAPVGSVQGPVAGPAGMYVFKVTKVSSSGPDAATETAKIRDALALQAAQADVAKDVDGLQDALAGQTPLDQLPGSLGLVAVQGTLDAAGQTPDGSAAPLPGDDALKAAIIKTAFAQAAGAPAALQNGPGGSYYALTVDKVMPPARAAYAQVQANVLAAWTADAQQRAAEAQAAKLLHELQTGTSFNAVSAQAVGDTVAMTPAITRAAPPAGVTPQEVSIIFSLKMGEATMLQTPDGFLVAQLAKIVQPKPADDAAGFAQVKQALDKAVQNDVGQAFLDGLQARANVSVNQKMLQQVYQ